MTALATYTIPKIDVQLSGTLASSPGIPLAANYTYSAAQAGEVRRPTAVGKRVADGQPGQARATSGATASTRSTSGSARTCGSAGTAA